MPSDASAAALVILVTAGIAVNMIAAASVWFYRPRSRFRAEPVEIRLVPFNRARWRGCFCRRAEKLYPMADVRMVGAQADAWRRDFHRKRRCYYDGSARVRCYCGTELVEYRLVPPSPLPRSVSA